jgi:hypothetical protein
VFRERWLPSMDMDGIRVGLNWSGPQATGYDLTGPELEVNLSTVAEGLYP